MRLLSYYVCSHFLRFFLGSLALCAALFLLIELFDHINEFLSRDVEWRDAVGYLAFKTPGILYQMVPVACLLASVLTFSTLNRHQEMTAIRAHGVSPLRLARPLYLLGALICVLLVIAQEYLVPYTNQAYNVIWRTRIRKVKMDVKQGLFKQGQVWYSSKRRIWNVQISRPLEHRLLQVVIYETDVEGRIRQRYDAAEARWNAQGWTLLNGTRHRFNAEGIFTGPPDAFTEWHVDFPEPPEEITAIPKQPQEMGLLETLEHAKTLQRQGIADLQYVVEFHGKLAFAALCMVMAGFGVPLALHGNRSGGTALALSLTLLSGFSYWIVHSFALTLGQSGQLSPALAAWLTNSVFGIGSVYLSARLQ